MVRAKARSVAPNAWVYTLMGWTLDQFADDKKPFTREELDQIAPEQSGVPAGGVLPRLREQPWSRRRWASTTAHPIPTWMPKGQVVRNAGGRATGVILDDGVRPIETRLLAIPRTRDRHRSQSPGDASGPESRRPHHDCDRPLCQRGRGAFGDSLDYRDLSINGPSQGRLNVRVYCQVSGRPARRDAALDKSLPASRRSSCFRATEYLNTFSYGERLGIASDNMLDVKPATTPGRVPAVGPHRAGTGEERVPLQVHATLEGTIDGFLDQIEQIDKEYPIRTLRWAFFHSTRSISRTSSA